MSCPLFSARTASELGLLCHTKQQNYKKKKQKKKRFLGSEGRESSLSQQPLTGKKKNDNCASTRSINSMRLDGHYQKKELHFLGSNVAGKG